MKKIGLILGVLAMVVGVALTSVVLADCVDDCTGPYQTCVKICEQITDKDRPVEMTPCLTNCIHGLNGCIKRCSGKDKRSEIEGMTYAQTVDLKEQLVQIPEPNCVCVECNRKCGTGHETWCSSYQKPKAKPDIETQKAVILSSSEENITETFLLALGGKLCCVEGGKVIGRCHELTPYYNPFNGECYASRDDCKKSYGGYDVCLKCTTPCK